MSHNEKKSAYFSKLLSLFQEYNKLFVVVVDMVGSKQIQNVRVQIRGKGELLMGKNTMVRKCIRDNLNEFPHLAPLLDISVSGNSGYLFVKDDFSGIQKILKDNFIGAAARSGVLAPDSVSVPAGLTTLQPTETSFFQALNIATRITKGNIEILNDVQVVTKGLRVSPGAAALLQKLAIKPFTYGIHVAEVFDNGSVFPPAVLDISDSDLLSAFQAGLRNVASVCLAVNYPTLVSLPHSFINGYKDVLSIALTTDYTFPKAQKVKDLLSNPEALAKALAAAAAAAPSAAAAAPAKAAAKAPEPEPEPEEEEAGMDFDLFD